MTASNPIQRLRLIWVVITVCSFLCASTLYAAESRYLRGKLVRVGDNDELVAAVGIDVALDETGDADRTKAQGLFRLFLPTIFRAGERVTLSVDEPDWRIQSPLDGEVTIPSDLAKTVVTVRLLPVGYRPVSTEVKIGRKLSARQSRSKTSFYWSGQQMQKAPDLLSWSGVRHWLLEYLSFRSCWTKPSYPRLLHQYTASPPQKV